MNCAECTQPATVLNGDVPLCGTCFYRRALGNNSESTDDATRDVWRRLSEAVTALEALVTRISGEVEELVKKRNHGDS